MSTPVIQGCVLTPRRAPLAMGRIRPYAYLESLPQNDYHLILAHHVIQNDVYAQYYQRALRRGATVILDNDAWETGRSASLDNLCEAIERLEANNGHLIVVMPDVLRHPTETLEASIDGYNFLQPRYPRIKALLIPQGHNAHAWHNCLVKLLQHIPDPALLGISRCQAETPEGIPFFSQLAYVVAPTIQQHLFGVGTNYQQYCNIGSYPWIRGFDTAKGTTAALAQMPLAQTLHANQLLPGRPKGFFDTPMLADVRRRIEANETALYAYIAYGR